jgi:AraC family transcriptional regulator, transcriptional activator of pobA
MQFKGKSGEFIVLEQITSKNCNVLKEILEGSLTVLWFVSDNNKLTIDGVETSFQKNQIVFLTEFHNVEVNSICNAKLVKFNRPFYCVLDHDIEVGCKGILFFGASQLPIIKIPINETERFETLWKMFAIEMASNDDLKIDMLQMMLKRYLILCTRIFKSQSNYPTEKIELDIVREFNFLVEQHFKTKFSVADYAEILNKSPKTISNLFSKLGSKTALQYIQERRSLEAKRLLQYSERKIQEIAYDIGFEDVQAFSRFFKNLEGVSPSNYREQFT